jgi:hypothetical protein
MQVSDDLLRSALTWAPWNKGRLIGPKPAAQAETRLVDGVHGPLHNSREL